MINIIVYYVGQTELIRSPRSLRVNQKGGKILEELHDFNSDNRHR